MLLFVGSDTVFHICFHFVLMAVGLVAGIIFADHKVNLIIKLLEHVKLMSFWWFYSNFKLNKHLLVQIQL